MDENNETRACLKKKPETDRSTENNPMPYPQTQQTYPNMISELMGAAAYLYDIIEIGNSEEEL